MSEEPLLAEIVTPQPPSAPKVGCAILGCLGSFLLLLAIIVGAGGYCVYLFVQVANEQTAREREAQQALQAESSSAPQRTAEIVAAFSAEQPGVPPEELAQLQAIFDKALQYHDRAGNAPEIAEVFDTVRFCDRIMACPETQSLNYFQKQSARAEFGDSKVLAWLTDKLTIVHVARREDGLVVVSGYVGLESNSSLEQRWLLTKHGNSWRIVDCEMCDWGCWRTQLHARHLQMVYTSSSGWERFDRATDQINRANDFLDQGDTDRALAELERVDFGRMDALLADELRIRTLQVLGNWSPAEKRLKIAQAVQQPEHWPRAAFSLAEAHADLGNHQAAVESAKKYMAQVGPTWGINQLLLTSYEQLGDKPALATAYRHILRVRPQDFSSLAGLIGAGAEMTEIMERLKKLPDPLEGAANIVWQLAYSDDSGADEATKALLEFLEREGKDSLPLLETKARLAYRDDDYPAALEFYLAAWKAHRDGEAGSRLCTSYFEAAIAAEQVEKAFEQAPDQRAALRFLANDYLYWQEYGVEKETLAAALQTYRQQQGDDAHTLTYVGKLELEDKQYAQAGQHLREALQRLPVDAPATGEYDDDYLDREDLAASLGTALLKQGRVEEAYQTAIAEASDAGWRLISQLNLSEERQREQAAQLVSLQRARKPGDPWTGLMEAKLLDAQQKPLEAWEALPKNVPESDYALDWPARNLALKLLSSGSVPLARYADVSPPEKMFQLLAQHLAHEEKWELLPELLRLEEESGRKENLVPWQVELLFHRKEYQTLTELAESHVASWLDENPQSYQQSGSVFDRLVRSLVQLQRYDDALRIVQQYKQHLSNAAVWEARVELARGNIDQAIEVLDREADRSQYQLYNDPDFGRLARAPEVLPLRQKIPPALPNLSTWRRAELLLSQSVSWDDDALTALTREALGSDAQVQELRDLQRPEGTRVWRLVRGDESFLVFSGPRSNDTTPEPGQLPDDPRIVQAISSHQAWIVVVPTGEISDAELAPVFYPLAVSLAGEHCLAVRFSDSGRTMAWDDDLKALLQSENLQEQLSTRGDEALGWLVREPEKRSERRPVRAPKWRDFSQRLAQQTPPESARVCLKLPALGCTEELWLRVLRIDGEPSRYPQFVVTPEKNSLLLPELQPGEPYLAAAYQLHDFEYSEGGVTQRGSQQ
jgi:tetratricopeptide (TPR) repeat protein